jgi:hypothetical protein
MPIKTPTRQVSGVSTRPAPLKGIDSYDSLIAMPEGYAIILRNLFPQPYGCQVRQGYVRHAINLGGAVETLASHNALTPKLYAFVSKLGGSCDMVDVTAPNQSAPTPKQTFAAPSNARWQFVNFPNAAGVNLIAVNGQNDLMWVKQDGTIQMVTAGSGSGNTISNVDPKTLVHVCTHQKRLWYVQQNTTIGWYMPPEQITGSCTAFNFGPLFSRGGTLTQLISWTIDDGNGSDDHLIAISSEGEVAVYDGIDPSSSSSWQLQGVYYAGAPIGRRCAIKYGGDVMIITQAGFVFMSDLLKSTKVNPANENISKYVQHLVSQAATAFASNFGWQPFLFPPGNMLMINIPASNNTHYQYVLNYTTAAWCEFIGYDALCWELHQQLPIYGTLDGKVYRAWERFTDGAILANDGTITEGADILSEAQTSFSYFNSPGKQKHFKMVNPAMICTGSFNLNLTVDTDFRFDSVDAPASFPQPPGGVWDDDKWDMARWAYGLTASRRWISVAGVGVAGSLRVRFRTNTETYWVATDWLTESGGVM